MQFHARKSPEECLALTEGKHFYHAFDLANGLKFPGEWDISKDIEGYRFPDMRGKRVLDLGPASGWFSFYLESLGADVTVLESRGYGDFDVYGVDRYTAPERAPDRIVNGQKLWDGPYSASFWAMHEMLGSRVKFVNGKFYDAPELFAEPFDIVLACNILQHVRDPIGVLRAAHAVCRGLCIVVHQTWSDHDDSPWPSAQYPFFHLDRISWAQPNKVLFEHWFKAAGFQSVNADHFVKSTPDQEHRNQEGIVTNAPFQLRLAHAVA